MNTRKLGNEYEDLACEHLENLGMKIICRNYRRKIGEIDIIARDGKELVFIEVKYRKNRKMGGALFAIPREKQQKIMRVAQWFMAERHIPADTFCRFDAVLIDGSDITHIRKAW